MKENKLLPTNALEDKGVGSEDIPSNGYRLSMN